jgi:DNA-formamidopyrimidine glycosylase
MTGSWNRLKTKHSRIGIYFNDGDKLYFNDIRNFGTFQLKTRIELEQKTKSIGPDMLSSPPSSSDFIYLLRKKNQKNICDVLMNQKVISGVGNYVKAESLWYSRINPHANVEDLTDENLETLFKAVIFVLNKSYKEQGASIQSYYTFDGEEGKAVTGFVVYGRSKDYNGYNVLKEQTPDKRTTHWTRERQTVGGRTR